MLIKKMWSLIDVDTGKAMSACLAYNTINIYNTYWHFYNVESSIFEVNKLFSIHTNTTFYMCIHDGSADWIDLFARDLTYQKDEEKSIKCVFL